MKETRINTYRCCDRGPVLYILAPSDLARSQVAAELICLMVKNIVAYQPCKIILDASKVKTWHPGLPGALIELAKLVRHCGTQLKVCGAEVGLETSIGSREPKLVSPFATIGEDHTTPPA